MTEAEWRRPRTCGECAEHRDGACAQSFEEARAVDPACPLFLDRASTESCGGATICYDVHGEKGGA